MENRTYGYARVSTKEQNLDRQLLALAEHGIQERDIIADKESGKDLDRKGYQLLKDGLLRRGDTLVVTSLDRLSRSKGDIKRELEYFRANGIRLKVLDLPTTMLDFPDGQEWIQEMVNNILIEVLSTIAEQERVTIRRRQAEGIAAVGKAEAEAIRAKALAEAEGIDKKAEAMKKYGEAAVIEMVMQALPEIAKHVAEPLSRVDKITMYGEGNSAKLLEDIITGTSQVTEGITQSMGIDVKSLVAGMLGGRLAGGEDKTIIIQGPAPTDQAGSAPAGGEGPRCPRRRGDKQCASPPFELS